MRVFISYARDDEAAVVSLAQDLQQAGVTFWLDKKLGGGAPWWNEILKEIRGCTVFAVALSDKWLKSQPCRSELEYAQELRLPVLSVQIGEVASYRIDPIFTFQVVDYRQPTAAGGLQLMRSLHDSADQYEDLPDPLPEPPPLPYAYLQRLGAPIRGRAELSLNSQMGLVFDLRKLLREEHEPSAQDDIRNLLRELRDRRDVAHLVVVDIDEILGGRSKPPRKKKPAKRASSESGRDSIDDQLKTEALERLTIHYALDPIVRSLADGAPSTIVLQMVVNTVAALVGPKDSTRVCYFELQPGPPNQLVATTYAGRATDGNLPTWTSGAKDLIDAILDDSTLFVEDTQNQSPWRRRQIYRTFITVPVIAGNVAYGMLTLEAPNPGDLKPSDTNLLKVMAGLAAIALKEGAGRAGKPS